MMKCPWCERYIKLEKSEIKDLEDEEDKDFRQQRLNEGFWASIRETHEELCSINRILTPCEALEERLPVQIDMRTGEVSYGRFWFYSLAEERDKSLNRELRHFWVLSGVCSMSFTTPICCEFANATSWEDSVEFELENEEFGDIRNLTEKLRELLKTID